MFEGSLVALVTPFDGNNQVDYTSLKRLIDFHVEREILQDTGVSIGFQSLNNLFCDFSITTPGLHRPEGSERGNR